MSGLYYADFISFYSPTQLCGGGTTKSNSNELPISVPLSVFTYFNKSVPKMKFEAKFLKKFEEI
ncbi:Peptide deformylase [Streptococcus cristatus]|uniref:Peptide deformylase n=1 Tax=Streptococcus cristatus TaxID=45634 RepID=A0A139MYR2_STRCR|nr:Peptide deformylase [Streptococcus cristatus]